MKGVAVGNDTLPAGIVAAAGFGDCVVPEAGIAAGCVGSVSGPRWPQALSANPRASAPIARRCWTRVATFAITITA